MLGPLLREEGACLARPLPRDLAALQLLVGYLALLHDASAALDRDVQELAASHLRDLLALAMGATRDAAETARKRGVRAARLASIKSSIRDSVQNNALSGADIAAQHRVTPRYLQMLFEEEGTTFTEFLIEERLVNARRMLASPRSAGRKIIDIAFSCGFGDVSYFNRKFRQRFGVSPSEVRERPRGSRLQ
jgi:AraC-like DNA-binding protein